MGRCLVAIMGPYPYPIQGGLTTHDYFYRMADATESVDAVCLVLPDLVGIVGVTKWRSPEWGPKHRGLVAMRHMASNLARDGDFDWLFIVENDCELHEETLERLVQRDKDIIVPRHEFTEHPLAKTMVYQPQPKEGQTGLHRIEWCGYPATLYKMSAFQDIDPMFLGGGEGIDYANWRQHGINAWMDLDVEAINPRMAYTHKVLWQMPGTARFHRGKDGHRCEGLMRGLAPTKITHPDAFAAQCVKCGYHVEYLPPEGYRGEALQQLGLLGSAVETEAESEPSVRPG